MQWSALGLLFIFAASMVNGTILHIAPVNIPDTDEVYSIPADYRLVQVHAEPVSETFVTDTNMFQRFYDSFLAWLGGFYHA